MPLLMKGREYKTQIEEGLKKHQKYLPVSVSTTLSDFAMFLEDDTLYDFFSCSAELMLRVDKDVGAIMADLMKVANTEHEMLEPRTISNLGYFFSDFLMKSRSLRHFRPKKTR